MFIKRNWRNDDVLPFARETFPSFPHLLNPLFNSESRFIKRDMYSYLFCRLTKYGRTKRNAKYVYPLTAAPFNFHAYTKRQMEIRKYHPLFYEKRLKLNDNGVHRSHNPSQRARCDISSEAHDGA